MAKYFLGSIGDAEAYRVTTSLSGETTMDLVFTSKTLTDSAVNISVNKEQIIDSYNGAPAGVFYHSPNVNITLSDILWNPKFVEVALGGKFSKLCEVGNFESYTVELKSDSGGLIDLERQNVPYPEAIKIPSYDSNNVYLITVKTQGTDDWYTIGNEDYDHRDHVITNLLPNTNYCIKYQIASNQTSLFSVMANIVPEELFLVITTPVFMAECSGIDGTVHNNPGQKMDFNVSSGKMVGKIVYEVPRWALDGDLSFSFSPSSTSGMHLTGTVLESIENEEEPVFMRLREFITPRVWYEGLVEIFTTDEYLEENTSPTIYGVYADGTCVKIEYSANNIMFVFEVAETHDGTLTSAPEDIFTCDGVDYNVTGKFGFSSAEVMGEIYIKPAIVWKDENSVETLVILDKILCTLNTENF